MKKILFICLGNICRSPAADGIMKHLVAERGLDDEFLIDSAGINMKPQELFELLCERVNHK